MFRGYYKFRRPCPVCAGVCTGCVPTANLQAVLSVISLCACLQDFAAANDRYITELKLQLKHKDDELAVLRSKLKKLAYDDAQHVAAATYVYIPIYPHHHHSNMRYMLVFLLSTQCSFALAIVKSASVYPTTSIHMCRSLPLFPGCLLRMWIGFVTVDTLISCECD
jgi:hypothetical protein